MRIMIVTDQYPPMVGGVPTVTRNLATDFANRGHHVQVIAPSYGSRDVRRLEHKVRVYRFSSFEWPIYEGLRIPFLPFGPMRNLIKKTDPDIIHIHSPIVLGNIAQILAGGLRKPVIATNHYLPINISRSLTADPLLGKYFSTVSYSYLVYFCNNCEYVTAPTKTALDLLYLHGLRAPARVISNGIDLEKFTPGQRDPEVLKRYSLPLDRPLVLHVNRLSEEKRLTVLLDAVPKMKVKAHIVLAGEGPEKEELQNQVKRLNIEDRVSFLGFVRDSDVLALRHSAQVFAIPSEAELQSIATMEALACGLPVVAADAYALPELVHHGKNGFLFQPGNSDEMAGQLDTILSDDGLREQMSQASLEIIGKHDRLRVLDEWEELYRRLSVEFREAKLRKQQQRLIGKYDGPNMQRKQKMPRSRMRHMGGPSVDQYWRDPSRPTINRNRKLSSE